MLNVRAESILKKFGVDGLIDKSLEELEQIRGLGKKGARDLFHFLRVEEQLREISKLPDWCFSGIWAD